MTHRLIIGSDHGGFDLKTTCQDILAEKGYQVTDVGCFDTTSVDYPVIAQALTQRILSGEFETGILICGTGIGMSIAANRFRGIRATLCHDHLTAKMARAHNNANILVLGGRVLGVETARDILDTWLSTPFDGGRHERRVGSLDI
jgi:ribose 5-phosphate isomerase B